MTLATLLGQQLSPLAGNKARLLDKAAGARLPVPRGFVLPHEMYLKALEIGAVVVSDSNFVVAERQAFLQLLPDIGTGSFAVRSAFSAEDTASSSMAGFFKSFLFVAREDVPERVCDVWQSAAACRGEGIRRDVLMMEMVNAKFAGVAFSEKNYEDDLVNFTCGTADALVSGQTAGGSLELPRLRSYEHGLPGWTNSPRAATETETAPSLSSSVLRRLSVLLRDIRRVFGDRDWDIEWADDGNVCWLIQIRPVTVASRRNECFTIANHKEILPDLPSPFMTSMIASCSTELLSYYRQFDSDLPDGRPFVEVYQGRPFLNLSYLTEMMRHWGLPTNLVTRSIGGTSDREFPLNLARFNRKLPVLVHMAASQAQDVLRINELIASMNSLVEQKLDSISTCVRVLRLLYKALVTGMFSVTAAMSGPLAACRKLGVLEEHGSRHETISSRMYLDLEPLRVMATASQEICESLNRGDLPEHQEFRSEWAKYLEKHGHRGVFESDISRPRLRECPEVMLKSLVHPLPSRTSKPARSFAGIMTLPIWWQASRAIKAREELRYNAMSGFARIRSRLLELAGSYLPVADDLWLLSIEEAQLLERGQIPSAEFISERKSELEKLATFQLPDLLHRFDDLSEFSSTAARDSRRKLTGISLTAGKVAGRALVLFEPVSSLPPGFEPGDTVLVARSVDAGWIPTFQMVKGVVVEIGGDLSHGSIILRETGIPAVTNVAGATRAVRSGERISMDAATGIIHLVDSDGL